jgi:hypothetical protein
MTRISRSAREGHTDACVQARSQACRNLHYQQNWPAMGDLVSHEDQRSVLACPSPTHDVARFIWAR